MNYLQRLIRRSLAQPETPARHSFTDPFSGEAEVDEALWPRSGDTEKAIKPETDSHNSITNIISHNLHSYSIVENTVVQTEPASLNIPFVPPDSRAVAPPVPKPGREEKARHAREDEPEVLNRNEAISIIDRIMAPYVESNSPPVPKAIKPEAPASEQHVAENVGRSDRESDLAVEKTPLQILPATKKKGPALTIHPPVNVVSPANQKAKRKGEVAERENNNQNKDNLIRKSQVEPCPRFEPVQQPARIVVVNQSSSDISRDRQMSGGSPHIGLGQL